MFFCRVCSAPVPDNRVLCDEHNDAWNDSGEYQRSKLARGHARHVAVQDFITRMRLERMNGGRT